METVRNGAYRILPVLAVTATLLFALPVPASAGQTGNKLDFNMQEYISVTPGVKVYAATRFIKTPTFSAFPHNLIFGTLTIEQKYEGEKLVQRFEEIYSASTNPTFSLIPPPNPFLAEFLYDVTPGGIVETGYRFIALIGPFPGQNTSTTKYEPGLLVFPYGRYAVGDMWGGAYKEEFFLVGSPDIKQYMSRVAQYAILGIETVTVPAGTFIDCIKIARFRGNQSDRIGWYAKGAGAVKFIFTNNDQTTNNTLNGMYELESMGQ
jgi:hypothetical protein